MATAPAHTAFLSDFERRIQPALAEPGHLREARRAAMERFAELGFPTRRMEEWRFTSVAPIAETVFAPPEGPSPLRMETVRPWTFPESHRLVFVDGFLAEGLSDLAGLPPGVTVGGLDDAFDGAPEVVDAHLARHASFQDHAFVALNTALFTGGAFVHVPRGVAVARPVHLLFLSSAPALPAVTYPRVLVVAEEAAQLTVVESYVGLGRGAYFTCPVTEIVVGEGAVVSHVKVQREGRGAYHVATQQLHQGRSGSFGSHSISLGGRLVRNDVNADLAGEGGSTVLNGLYLAEDEQHVDTHMRVEHMVPRCESHELYKGILDGRSSAVFNGLIRVRPGAQKTNAKQSNRNLLLSREAVANSNPQLEIFADDVKCTHGSTVGQLDDDAIFYLRSRGISREAATSILTYAFASEVVGRIPVAPVRESLERVLFERLPQGDVVRQAT